jgi:hypothetical protein
MPIALLLRHVRNEQQNQSITGDAPMRVSALASANDSHVQQHGMSPADFLARICLHALRHKAFQQWLAAYQDVSRM